MRGCGWLSRVHPVTRLCATVLRVRLLDTCRAQDQGIAIQGVPHEKNLCHRLRHTGWLPRLQHPRPRPRTGEGDRRDGDQRAEQHHDRQDHRGNDGNSRQDRHDDRNWNHGNGYQQRGYVQNQPRYVYNQPRYAYNQPQYYGHTQRYYRGGYLPRQYLSGGYYVNNWQAYPGLYAPPYGYQWVDTGGEFVLAALATGLIANLLVH